MLFGLQPGPMLIKNNPDLFWGTVASMYVGNGMLLILNLPLIGMWVRVLLIPYTLLFPLILLFCLVGVYIPNNSVDELWLMIFFGVVGYIFQKIQIPLAPLTLAMVIGRVFENAFRQSLLLSQGSLMIFFQRPISGTLISIAILLLVLGSLPQLWGIREKLRT